MSEIEELKTKPKAAETKKKSKLSNFLNVGEAKEGRSVSRSKAEQRQMKNKSIENNKKFGFFLTKKPENT